MYKHEDIIARLIKVARAAYDVADGTEHRGDKDHRPNGDDMKAMFAALDELDELPEPETHLSSPGGKAEYWLNQNAPSISLCVDGITCKMSVKQMHKAGLDNCSDPA